MMMLKGASFGKLHIQPIEWLLKPYFVSIDVKIIMAINHYSLLLSM